MSLNISSLCRLTVLLNKGTFPIGFEYFFIDHNSDHFSTARQKGKFYNCVRCSVFDMSFEASKLQVLWFYQRLM